MKYLRALAGMMAVILLSTGLMGCDTEVATVGVNNTSAAVRTTTCSLCDGDGVCYHCDGESYRDGRRCSVCDGKGSCETCGGAGKREVLVINGQDYVICSGCYGSGVCPLCSGEGQAYGGNCLICHGGKECIGCHGAGVTKLRGF